MTIVPKDSIYPSTFFISFDVMLKSLFVVNLLFFVFCVVAFSVKLPSFEQVFVLSYVTVEPFICKLFLAAI